MSDTRLHCIYRHTCPDGTVYIGQTFSGETEHRWQGGNSYKGQKFYEAIARFGWDNITHEVIEDNIPDDIVDERERFYIKQHDSFAHGWNATIGGKYGGWTHKESAVAMCALTISGYKDLADLLGYEPRDAIYENFNEACRLSDDCYKKVTGRSIITRHRGSQRRKLEAKKILDTACLFVSIAYCDASMAEKENDIKAVVDDTVGAFAAVLSMYGDVSPAPEDEEYVNECQRRHSKAIFAKLEELAI